MPYSASRSITACSMAHQCTDRGAITVQLQQQIHHQLAGAVIGDLPATVGLYNRDRRQLQDVFRLAGRPGEYRRVLQQPQFVCGVGVALCGECLHRGERRQLVINQPQMTPYKPDSLALPLAATSMVCSITCAPVAIAP